MRRSRWFACFSSLAFLVAILLTACSMGSPRFEGTLHDAISGGVIAEAQIQIADQVVNSDHQGRFRLELPLGEHEGYIAAPGYVGESVAFVLTEDAKRVEQAIALQPRILQGTVIAQDTGEPFSDVQIQYGETTIGPDAEATFTVEVRELSDLVVSCAGCLTSVLEQDEIAAAFGPDGRLLEPLELAIAPRVLSGIVHEPDGRPVEGAELRVGEQSALSNASGQYTLRFVQEGQPLSVTSAAHQPVADMVYNGQAEHEIVLEPWQASLQVLDQASELPLEGVAVDVDGEIRGHTDAQGQLTVRAIPGESVTLSSYGYLTETLVFEGQSSPVTLELNPVRLWGVLIDETDQSPLVNALVQIYRADQTEPELLRTDEQGQFDIPDGRDVSRLFIKAAGYLREDMPVTQLGKLEIHLEPFDSHGIYISFGLLMWPERIYELLDMVAESPTLNTVVIDVKGDWANIAWPSEMPVAQEIGAYAEGVIPIEEIIAACRERDIYTIARIVVFKDRLLAGEKPEWAIMTQSGEHYQDGENLYWSDPFRSEVWDYNIGLMLEAAEKGFDEVQFDYIRFPSEGRVSDRVYSQEATLESRTWAIREFLKTAYQAMEPTEAFLSADIFGLAMWINHDRENYDMGIGQLLEDMSDNVDYISPMLYPSTFNPANLRHMGISDVERYPYETLYYSVLQTRKRTDTKVRPWLQHYSARITYGIQELLYQRRGAEDAGSHGWLFWNARGNYAEEIFGPDPYSLLTTIPTPPEPDPEE